MNLSMRILKLGSLKTGLACMLMLLMTQAWGAIDVQEFKDETQRQRYQKLIEELRCPKCKNQNLVGTNSDIAMDLRREIHDMILEGKTDDYIVNFLVSRYGDFVLYRPRMQSNTYMLWFGPAALALIGLVVLGLFIKRRSGNLAADGLSADEEARLNAMMAKVDSPDSASSDEKE